MRLAVRDLRQRRRERDCGRRTCDLDRAELVGTSASRYLYVPATSNVKEYVYQARDG